MEFEEFINIDGRTNKPKNIINKTEYQLNWYYMNHKKRRLQEKQSRLKRKIINAQKKALKLKLIIGD